MTAVVLVASFLPFVPLAAQRQSEPTLSQLAQRLASWSAVTGYERAMVDSLLRLLPRSTRDRAGNAVLTLGEGRPKRLVVCPLDEPGYVVGSIREDGYLTLRRVPGQTGSDFDRQLEGHRVTLQGRRGPVPGIVAVRSVHLTRGRKLSAAPFTVDNAYVDVGARSRSEASALGLAVLTPLTLTKRPHLYGTGLLAAPVAGRRAACAALLAVAQQSSSGAEPSGAVLIAFAVEEELAERGVATLANAAGPFEETLVVDGKPGMRGALLRTTDPDTTVRWTGLGKVTRWSLAVGYPGTPVETVSLADADSLRHALIDWMGARP